MKNDIKETDDFNTYMEQNPRYPIPCEEMRDFLKYAQSRYKDFDQVNWSSYDNKDECEDEVKSYIGESMEALLLYKEWLVEKKLRDEL
jgi:hypothetical protein